MQLKNIKILYFFYIAASALIGAWGGYKIATGTLVIRDLLLAINLLSLVGCILGFTLLLSWWNKIDEASQEAHKIAWFFGGSFGLLGAIVLVVLNLFFDGSVFAYLLGGVKDAAKYGFEIGVTACVTLMGIGYMIHWALWWKKRS